MIPIAVIFFCFTIPLSANSTQEKLQNFYSVKETWKPFVEAEYEKHPSFFSLFWSTLETGNLSSLFSGVGSTYILSDSKQQPCFIIKPIDENSYCLNNPNHCPAFQTEKRLRPHIPSCQEALCEACCYEIAALCGLDITPPTFLAIFSHSKFFLFSPSCFQEKGSEKLCSIQQYLPNTKSLYAFLQEHPDSCPYFEEENFFNIHLFLWLTYDNDAHIGNFRVDDQNQLYKIDNGLCLPEKNLGFSNFLDLLPQAHLPISPYLKKKIFDIPIDQIEQTLIRFSFPSRFFALQKRISLLQHLIHQPNTTYHSINNLFSSFEDNTD